MTQDEKRQETDNSEIESIQPESKELSKDEAEGVSGGLPAVQDRF